MDFLADFVFAWALFFRFDAQTKRNVFKDAHVTKQGVMLKDKTDLAFARTSQGRIIVFQVDAAEVRGF